MTEAEKPYNIEDVGEMYFDNENYAFFMRDFLQDNFFSNIPVGENEKITLEVFGPIEKDNKISWELRAQLTQAYPYETLGEITDPQCEAIDQSKVFEDYWRQNTFDARPGEDDDEEISALFREIGLRDKIAGEDQFENQLLEKIMLGLMHYKNLTPPDKSKIKDN